MSSSNQLANGAAQQHVQDVARPLNVTDALTYLDAVKNQFQDNPDVYNQFLDIMKDFKSQEIDTPGVIQRVSRLFHGNPALIEGFNTFLPVGYRIEVDLLDPTKITVTTPLGTTTQSTNTHLNLSRLTRDVPGPPAVQQPPSSVLQPSSHPPTPSQHPLLPPPQHLTPVPVYPTSTPLMPTAVGPGAPGALPGSRSMTPHGYHPMGHGPGQPYMEPMYSPGPTHQMAAAEHLHNLNGQKPPSSPSATQVEKQPREFNHAIQYLNKIKARYSEDPNTYKQFLDILQTYHKEQKHSHDVYVQVQMLFADAPDLLSEFKNFLPEAVPISAGGTAPIPIMPQPGAGPSTWQGESPPSSQKKPQPSNKRKKPQKVEKESTPVPAPRPVASSSRQTKRVKQHHNQEAEPPGFSPYHQPPSPPPIPAYTQNQTQHPSHPPLPHSSSGTGAEFQSNPSAGKLLFFDKAKKHLENREVYEEFLKFLDLFSRDILDLTTLVERSKVFFGDGELMTAFKDLVGWDDRDNLEKGPPGSIRTGPSEIPAALPPDDGEGPSYRRLPPSDALLACSGRDEMCRSVLNDDWISHPTWASEEAVFVVNKKTPFEEALHKSEEERHEYHVQIEALTRTIAVFEPINSRIDEMTNEERASFRLKADLGGSGMTIYHKIIKKIYGRDMGAEVIQALQDCPSVAVPVVVNRLKTKHEEWKRAQRDWSRTWREVDHKNFYKSLDYQGINFKQNDKKSITTKYFVMDIQDAKKAQMRKWERRGKKLFTDGGPGHQLEFSFKNTTVLQDAMKMVFAFLERAHASYSSLERRGIEKFLRSFVPVMCMTSEPEFNGGLQLELSGMEDDVSVTSEVGQKGTSGRKSAGTPQSQSLGSGIGVPANDLRRKLLKTAREKLNTTDAAWKKEGSGAQSPTGGNGSPGALKGDEEPHFHDVWVKEASLLTSPESFIFSADKEKPFFANTTFYTLFRLLELLYSRLLLCHQIGAKYAAEKHASLLNNPVAVDLGLDDPNGPATVLAQTIEHLEKPLAEDTNVVYLYLLTACEKLFDNELDQPTFEEHMRWFFGTRAYTLFTLDKLITALIKQVQTILGDNKCLELWSLLKSAQSSRNISSQDIIRYRREAERHVGPDDHLYRLQWIRETRCMRIWLYGSKEASSQTDGSSTARWREYVSTYVMNHPTEWLPEPKKETSPVFLRRCVRMAEEGTAPLVKDRMRIRICLPTYKLMYEAGSEDFIVHDWGKDEEDMSVRARKREEERRRHHWLR
ncbi:hypothetical protein CPB83DRAFT_760648 [Crepidotus variabilis]|uniref:Histone deacetylase interacting domain-containing protein n=1 Tax=Crepidotus variabilis TaxID=179855 RepID=A0A9P6EMJ4_9AGAR|nr:hypothetical protein CPB83DRAFT_760648 [Crepidotus variabilis]